MLGVNVVVAECFDRIHRTNLVGMGVLPLQFGANVTLDQLGLEGTERFDVLGLNQDLGVQTQLILRIHRLDGEADSVPVVARLDTLEDVEYWRHGGILPRVWRSYV